MSKIKNTLINFVRPGTVAAVYANVIYRDGSWFASLGITYSLNFTWFLIGQEGCCD